ncbi:MAG: 30S ribosomal protein S7 [Phycisphaeraceae bacterium]|nr:MAG: 30S ribosomal protein S7 [Phycisphaeraceae bacterium]
MGRKKYVEADRLLRPDPRYGDRAVSRFINCVMKSGQKAPAQRCVYDAFDVIDERLAKETAPEAPKNALELFHRAVENVMPYVEVRSKRIGGANYQVPMQVSRKRQQSLSIRWILEAVRSERGRPMHQRLADELYNAARGEGKAMSTRDQTHKMAEANRAFAHFAN